jgi:chitinase
MKLYELTFTRPFIIRSLLFFSALAIICLSISGIAPAEPPKKHVVIGYVGGYKGLVNTDKIDAAKLTHINYAFVDVKDGKAFLTNLKTDSTNFRKLNLLKKKNPDLKILISIGGWAWSENFSDAVLTEASREVFAKSSVDIIRQYKLDGVDIDWEYPGMPGEDGNVYRKEDKENFTLMFKAIRKELDVLEKESRQKKLLTTATAGFASFLNNTEMAKAAEYLDYINLMTYDLFAQGIAAHHTNLYRTKVYPMQNSADDAVNAYVAAGVPIHKLVIGIAFYERVFNVENPANKGVGDKRIGEKYGKGYTYLKDSLVNKKGYVAYQDKDAMAPYLFNEATKQFITYDDEWSVRNKCLYVMDKKMGGVMFWEYTSDPKGYLLDEINKTLK